MELMLLRASCQLIFIYYYYYYYYLQLYSASQNDVGNSEYEFRFHISQLESRDFRSYDLEVSNEVGTALVSFRITQGKVEIRQVKSSDHVRSKL